MLDVNWGSSTQAQAYKTALITVQTLNTTEIHVKTYTPQILVMTGSPNMRPSLTDFAYLLCKNNSLMICGDVSPVSLISTSSPLPNSTSKITLSNYRNA